MGKRKITCAETAERKGRKGGTKSADEKRRKKIPQLDQTRITIRDLSGVSWVSHEVLDAVSLRENENSVDELRLAMHVTPNKTEDSHWVISHVPSDERICSARSDANSHHYLMMYPFLFFTLGVRFPFSSFMIELLKTLRVCPSQLHPNAWAYIRVFEMVCSAYGLLMTPNIFLYLFCVVWSSNSWVSFRRKIKFAHDFQMRIHNWNVDYIKIYPSEGHHPFFLNQHDNSPLFPLYWTEPLIDEKVEYHADDLNNEECNTVICLAEIAKLVANGMNAGSSPTDPKIECLSTHTILTTYSESDIKVYLGNF